MIGERALSYMVSRQPALLFFHQESNVTFDFSFNILITHYLMKSFLFHHFIFSFFFKLFMDTLNIK